MRFNTYNNLKEHLHKSSEPKSVVFAFDTFRIPTRSHKRMVDRVISEAFHQEAEHMVIVRRSASSDKYNVLCAIVENIYPSANVVHQAHTGNIMDALFMLQESGYTDVTMVSDKDTCKWIQEHWSDTAESMFDSFTLLHYGDDIAEVKRLRMAAMAAASALEAGKFSAATGIKDEMLDVAIQHVRETY